MLRGTIAFALLFLLLGTADARAEDSLVQIGGTFDHPIYVTSDPGNPNRLFVVERPGTIELVENGVTSQFADLTSLVSCCEGERGLISIAMAPDFDQTGTFYVDYAGLEAAGGEVGDIHVDAFTAVGDSVELGTRKPMLTIPHSFTDYHNAGQLQIGPDGDLYISTGDGGGGAAYPRFPQSLASPLGKILRIHPDPGGPAPYFTIPSDNPFAAASGDYEPIWSYGLRNPFRFSFDRQTGAMVIGDVGFETEEEIDYAPMEGGAVGGGGENYGWDCREGLIDGPYAENPEEGCTGGALFKDPVFVYQHDPDPEAEGESRCAIIGGYVVRDQGLADLLGRYLYGDLCSGALRSLDLSSPATTDRYEALGRAPFSPYALYSFGEDSCGRVYVVAGNVYRVEGAEPDPCGVLHVSVNDPARGSVGGTGIDCPGDCAEIYQLTTDVQLTPQPTAGFHFSGWEGTDANACEGTGPCTLSMDRDRSLSADFEPDAPPDPPSISITAPADGAAYTQGQAINAAYSCTPPEGTSVATCEGTVADGAALDTTTLGPHVFTVDAEDADGGIAAKEVSYTVDAAPIVIPPDPPPPTPSPPETTLDSHPKAKLKRKGKAMVSFGFSSSTAGATFECKLDERAFAPCSSPRSYGVKPGKHTFSVVAVGAGGSDPTPATFSFRVKKTSRPRR